MLKPRHETNLKDPQAMFGYFGSKASLARYYDAPRYPLIIEPFAGAAGYSVYWALKTGADVWLNDFDHRLFAVWKWLISAKRKDILAIPELQRGEFVSSYQLETPVALLLGQVVNRGNKATGANRYQGWAADDEDIIRYKRKWLRTCPKLRHWKITDMDYRDLPNVEATWFIDPPYRAAGKHYRQRIDDYKALGKWCRRRKGQVIVCEGEGHGDWLPFVPFRPHTGLGERKLEYWWTNDMGT